MTTKAMGVERVFHLTVTEPEPGRVLHEADVDAGVATSFVVGPMNGGTQSRVTIISDMKSAAGLMGVMERWLTPPMIRRIFQQELNQLNDYARTKTVLA